MSFGAGNKIGGTGLFSQWLEVAGQGLHLLKWIGYNI
jgi:hypothetical protein